DARRVPRRERASAAGAAAQQRRAQARDVPRPTRSSLVESLTQQKCVACRRDAPTLTDAEIADLRPQVPDWELIELDGIKRLRRVFSFDDFAHALEFTNEV